MSGSYELGLGWKWIQQPVPEGAGQRCHRFPLGRKGGDEEALRSKCDLQSGCE